MEEDVNFNAGCGSVLTREGKVEMEALIVDGKNIKVGENSLDTGITCEIIKGVRYDPSWNIISPNVQ